MFRHSLAPDLSLITSVTFPLQLGFVQDYQTWKDSFLYISWALSFFFRKPPSLGTDAPNIFPSLYAPYLKFFSTNPYIKPLTSIIYFIFSYFLIRVFTLFHGCLAPNISHLAFPLYSQCQRQNIEMYYFPNAQAGSVTFTCVSPHHTQKYLLYQLWGGGK